MNNHMKPGIPQGLSLYLDLIRFLSAVVVVLHHTWSMVFPSFPLPWPGHSAVVTFFVLSGYVIAHSAKPELGLRAYAYNRMARVLPVALAATMLSVAISPLAGTTLVVSAGDMSFSWKSLALNMLFLGQSWTDVPPSFNLSFWSLNYEVWYYIIFGLWMYIPNRLFTGLAALIAGPKILLLFPVWLLGVALYKWAPALEKRSARKIFTATIVCALAFIWFDVGIVIRENMRLVWPVAMGFTQGSSQFVGDFLLGIIIAANFMAATNLEMAVLVRIRTTIRFLSSFTFSIYLFHMPFVVLIWNGLVWQHPVLFYASLSLFIVALGQVTERRTNWYRSAFQWRAAS
jgi:peptidoglycan/LPS O-acetylase OafA/YrhL